MNHEGSMEGNTNCTALVLDPPPPLLLFLTRGPFLVGCSMNVYSSLSNAWTLLGCCSINVYNRYNVGFALCLQWRPCHCS